MFQFKKDQKTFNSGGIKVGGQPGENPPLQIASMFHNKDRIVTDRKGNFDRAKAAELIKTMEQLSASTGIPSMVAMVANSPEEAKIYIDFYRETTDHALRHRHVGRGKTRAGNGICRQAGTAGQVPVQQHHPLGQGHQGPGPEAQRPRDQARRGTGLRRQDQSPAGRLKSLENILARAPTASKPSSSTPRS